MNKCLICGCRRAERRWLRLVLLLSSFGLQPYLTHAVITTNVTIGDDFFSPASVAISAGDSVKWNWSGIAPHNSTSTSVPSLWGSPTMTGSGSFTFTFANGGTYPYECTIHVAFGMTGSVSVQAAPTNAPPSVAITSPTNGTVLSAPWTGAIRANASDTDDSVSRVQFFAGTSSLGIVSNPPASLSLQVTNLAAGSYTLKAVATDSRGATNTSAGISIQVLTPAAIEISAARRPSPTSFQFLYTATPGLSYVVERAAGLPTLTAISTNVATTNHVSYTDNNATSEVNFYSVKLQPNP